MSANGSSPRVVNTAVKRNYTFKNLSNYVSEDLSKDVADKISGSSAASSAPCSSSNQDRDSTHLLPPLLPYAVKVENTTKKKRFVATTTENIAAIKERRFKVSTVKSTHWV